MMNRRFSSGKAQLIGRGLTYPVPIPLDPGPYEGGVVHGDTGMLYASDGIEWRAIVDEARAAEIAEDVAADVARLAPPDLLVRVGPGPVLEGERYPTLTAALQYMSGFVSSYRDDFDFRPQPWILIESGVVLSEQIIATGVRFGDVVLTSEDEIVYYDLAALEAGTGAPGVGDGIVHSFMSFSGGSTPRITGVRFQPLAESAIPQDPDLVALHGAYTPNSRGIFFGDGASAVIRRREIDFDGTLITPRLGGFEGATFNARAGEGTSLTANGASFDGAGDTGLRAAGNNLIVGCVARGGGSHGLRLTGGSALFASNRSGPDGAVPGVFGQDFRKTEGVDSPEDIAVSGGARVHINTPISNFRGGFNIPFNTFSSSGTVTRTGTGNRTYTRDNIVGTVSQSGGVPTGAVIQRDSNSDGSYTRWADGTQICWANRAASSSGAAVWTYPIAFANSQVRISVQPITNAARAGAASNVTATTMQFSSWTNLSDSAARQSDQCDLKATGRWF